MQIRASQKEDITAIMRDLREGESFYGSDWQSDPVG